MSLVITRRPGEILCVGSDIEIQIMEITGQQAKIAIRAPKEVRVDRWEVRQRQLAGIPPPSRK